jgi:hypothetical protein
MTHLSAPNIEGQELEIKAAIAADTNPKQNPTLDDIARVLCRTDCNATGECCNDGNRGCTLLDRSIYIPQAIALLNAGAIIPGWRLRNA